MKLRGLRTAKRLTLSRLAAETGLSTALLSKLETDRMIPTLPTLATISRVYGVGMSYFFSEPSRHTLSITRKAHLQNGHRSQDAVHFVPLHALTEATRLQVQMLEIPAGSTASLPDGVRAISVMAYVLEGKLEMNTGGMRETLDVGDCVCLETEMSLSWNALGKHRCRLLVVTPANG
jgi:transcriptional regulator with XRE-family HTH domain